jgi:hypothetical protein
MSLPSSVIVFFFPWSILWISARVELLQVIDTDYVTVGDEKFHPECVKCCICRKPVKKYELHKGKGARFTIAPVIRLHSCSQLPSAVYCPEDYELELKAGGTYSKPATHGVRCAECAREILYGDPVVAEVLPLFTFCMCLPREAESERREANIILA